MRLSNSIRRKIQRYPRSRLGALLALGLAFLFGASLAWAQGTDNAVEYAAHLQRAEELLRSKKPGEALGELDAAFSARRETRVLYLHGIAQQMLGNFSEALLLFQRFLSASTTAEVSQDRDDASRRIAELRRVMESGAPSDGLMAEGLAEPLPHVVQASDQEVVVPRPRPRPPSKIMLISGVTLLVAGPAMLAAGTAWALTLPCQSEDVGPQIRNACQATSSYANGTKGVIGLGIAGGVSLLAGLTLTLVWGGLQGRASPQ